jgi:hypothetical protein
MTPTCFLCLLVTPLSDPHIPLRLDSAPSCIPSSPPQQRCPILSPSLSTRRWRSCVWQVQWPIAKPTIDGDVIHGHWHPPPCTGDVRFSVLHVFIIIKGIIRRQKTNYGQLHRKNSWYATEPGRNTFGTCYGETGLKIQPDVFRHDNVYFEQSTIFSFSHKKRDAKLIYSSYW